MDLPRTLVLLVATALLLPPGQASPAQASAGLGAEALPGALDALRAFGIRFAGDAAAAPDNRTVAGAYLDLQAAGDVDGDGADDVVASLWHYDVPEGQPSNTVQALSGRDLATPIWDLGLADNQIGGLAGDVDGDGVADVYRVIPGAGQVSSTPTSLGYATAGELAYSAGHEWELLSGKGLKPLAKSKDSFTVQESTVRAYPLVGSAGAGETRFSFDDLMALGHGVFGDLGYSFAYTDAGAGASLAYGSASSTRTHAGYTAASGTGVAFEGDVQDVLGFELAPVDAVAGLDLAFLVAEDAAEAHAFVTAGSMAAQHARSHRIAAVGSSDGKLLWERTFESAPVPALERQSALLAVGDLDGDGRSELEYLDIVLPASGVPETTVRILAGKDGATLHEEVAVAALKAGVPFGDVDGDGKAELLALAIDADDITAGPAKADLVPLWTVQLTPTENPLAFGGPTYDTALTMPDWDGDAAPDLVVLDRAKAQDGTFAATAYGGRAGAPLWTLDRADVHATGVLLDVTGVGDLDLYVATATDPSDLRNATVALEVLAGESAATVLADTLVQPGGPHETIRVHARNLGDLDGAGADEIGVAVERASAAIDDGDVAVQWRIYPGAAGAETLVVTAPQASPDEAASTPVQLEREAPPAVRQAPTLEPAADEATPGPGALALLVALAAVALWAARRRA